MHSLRRRLAIAPILLAACGGGDDGATTVDAAVDAPKSIDAKVFLDAPPPSFDFTCSTNTTPPPTADDPIALSGTAQQVGFGGGGVSITGLAGATVDLCDATAAMCTGPNKHGTADTDATGNFSIANIDTGGTPLNDYLVMTKSGSRTTYVFPASPFTADQANIPFLTFPTANQTLILDAGLSCPSAQAIVGIAVTDCAGNPVTDTTNINITVKQGGTPVAGATVKDLGAMVDPQAAGTFLVCGIPANAATEVSATYMGTNFLAHNVKTVAGETTATILVPGY